MKDVVRHHFNIDQDQRSELKGHNPLVLWLTGYSGSGKSTIANILEVKLFKEGVHTYILDGDNVRMGLCSDLSFSEDDRAENIRRIAHLCDLMVDAGLVVIACFVSPFLKDRQFVKDTIGKGRAIEVFIDCNFEECEKRDPKGLYKKARSGEIASFTGIGSPYEKPENPDIHIHTDKCSAEEAVEIILREIQHKLR